MEQQLSEKGSRESAEVGALENSLRALWERAQAAAELIAQLRDENQSLRGQAHDLEKQLRRAEEALQDANEHLKAQPPAQEVPGNGQDTVFANGEREALAGRVKDLLARLDAYL